MGFWEATWQERADVLYLAFGETEPPKTVCSFSWKDRLLPGACALCFPPIAPTRDPVRHGRDDWLYLTMGLSQPLDKKEVDTAKAQGRQYSARGFELGFIVSNQSDWPAQALYYFLTHITDGEEIAWGHRFPFGFCENASGHLTPCVGRLDGLAVVGDIRAVLFWPYLFPGTAFYTSTGKFLPFIATGITEDEWALARRTTTVHVLLLLCRAGVCQRTLPRRRSLRAVPRWAEEWKRIESLEPDQCEAEVEAGIGRWHRSLVSSEIIIE